MGQSNMGFFQRYWKIWISKVKSAAPELSFFWFLTVVLSGFFIFITLNLPALPLSRIILASVFMLCHVLMYWFNLALDMEVVREFVIYILIQLMLIAATTVLIGNDFMLLPALIMSLVGQITGFTISLFQKMGTITLLILTLFISMWFIEPDLFQDPTLIIVGITLIIVFQLIFTGVYNQTSKAKNEAQEAYEKLEIANIKISQMTRTEERQRIARELHDTLAQGLTGIILQLDAVDHYLSKGDASKAQELVQRSMKAARETLAESRDVIDDLRIPVREQSLQERINQLIENENTHFSVDMTIPETLSVEEENLIEKIMSECVLNIHKHARAKLANIILVSTEQEIQIEVSDNGIGFDPNQIQNKKGHYGILGMRERVKSTNGIFTLETQPTKGCKINISLPRGRNH